MLKTPPLWLSVLVLVTALAGTSRASQVLVATASPYDSCTSDDVGSQSGTNYPDSLVEPFLAVNPTNPNNIVSMHQQDRYSDGGSRGDVIEVSTDGGSTWTQVTVADIANCDGGPWSRGTDPWLAFTTNGDLYLVSQSFSAFSNPQQLGMIAARSSDGGFTWSSLVNAADTVVQPPRFPYDDKVSMTADPYDPYTLYMVWDRYVQPRWGFDDWPAHFRYQGQYSSVYISRTTDGGQTWSVPAPVYRPGGNNYTSGPQIAVLPDRTLVMAVNVSFLKKFGKSNYWVQYMMTSRSKDGGNTWSTPTRASVVNPAVVYAPPYFTYIRAGGDVDPIVQLTADASGRLLMTWQDGGFGKASSIVFSVSIDRGFHWTPPVPIDKSGSWPALNPMIAVAPDGTIGISYFDYRYSDGSAAPVSDWLVRCSSNCTNPANWSETFLGGATNTTNYDLNNAPYADGLFLGDYQGLTANANGFQALYALTGPSYPQTQLWFTAAP